MTIGEAVARARKDIGVSSDDSTIGSRYVYSMLKSTRSELLRQDINKRGVWMGFEFQTLRSFEMELVDRAEVEEFKSGTLIYKSKDKMPSLLDTADGKVVGGVFTPNGTRIHLTNYTKHINSQGRRFSSNTAEFLFRDKHFYIVRYPAVTKQLFIDIDALFESPEEVERLNADCTTSCLHYPDLPFYLPGYLENRLFRIVKADLSLKLGIPLDNTNNGQEDPIQQPVQTRTNG